jgi:predicted acylesterase/phospholipase RssA
MRVLVLPVSGGGFPGQLAIIQHLCESHLIPDITLASSGGNVAAYVAAAADWKWAAIERIGHELNKDLFAKPWNSFATVSFVVGYFEGNVYNKGNGVKAFLTEHFNAETITKYEIWTGTYNRAQQRGAIFCNRSQAESVVCTDCIDYDLTQSNPPVYADGNFDIISSAGVASASIPALVPPEMIEGEPHIDGGIAGASPLAIMQEPILQHTRTNDEPLHIIYVNSVDLAKVNIKPSRNVIDTWRQATKDLVRSQTGLDRMAAYNLFRCHPGTLHKDEFACTYDNMERVKTIESQVKYSMLELYPTETMDVDLASFTGPDVVATMKKLYNKCACRLWWLTDAESVIDVHSIIQECKSSV